MVEATSGPEKPTGPENSGGVQGALARAWASGSAVVAAIAAATLALHLATARVYGLFIDELYFLACGEHLAWGYVDMPPLTAAQAWLARALFGHSIVGVRLFPALAAASLVLLAGALARALGGRRYAQGLAALAVAIAPGDLFAGSYLSMNSIEPLLWMGCALVLIRIIATGNARLWLVFGLLAGIGLENKDTMLLFGFALVAGLLLTRERRLMANGWFVAGGAIAFLIFLPNLVWMIQHHFPHLEMLANIRRDGRNVELSPLQFIAQQAILTGPLATPLWVAGLGRLLVGRGARPYRALGLAYVVTIAVLLALDGRVYYPLPAYAMLFAAGAVALEEACARPRLAWVKPATVAALALAGALLAPLAMPLLPPQTYIRYTATIHLNQPRIEHRTASALPQLFADRFGWPEMAQAVAKAYFALPPAERSRCAIFGNDYGQAGAIDFYGPALGLPKAISGHLSYWYWGPRAYTGDVMLVMGDRRAVLEREFDEVQPVAEIGQRYAMAQEHFTLYLCRRPKGWTLPAIWPRLKVWD